MTWTEIQQWLDACPKDGSSRQMHVEIGVSTRANVIVQLDELQPENKPDEYDDDRIRTRLSEGAGRTLPAALRKLKAPKRWGRWY